MQKIGGRVCRSCGVVVGKWRGVGVVWGVRESLLDINCRIVGLMSELGTRKGQRTKKVPKHMQYDDADYGTYLSVRTADQKEKSANANEISQIARLLTRYVASINQKLKDHQPPEPSLMPPHEGRNLSEPQTKRLPQGQNAEGTLQKPSALASGTGKRGRDGYEKAVGEGKGRGEGKKAGQGSRGPAASSSLQPDLQYHSMLSDHIRSAYPNISSISPDMLKTLDLPKQSMEGHNGHSKSRMKEERLKGPQLLRSIKGGREGKEDLKPFKRQSYHVAIAYHIHLKRIKSTSPSPTEIDPTYPARKLRENQAQQQPPRQ